MTKSDKEILLFFGAICGIPMLMLLLSIPFLIKMGKEQDRKEERVLDQSIGRTIESYTMDGNTIHFHYENGGGFTVRGYKGLTIE